MINPEAASLPGARLGLRPTDPDRLASVIRLPLTGAAPQHALTADHITRVQQWMLGGNDQFGTCGPTSVANLLVLTYLYLTGEEITVTDAAVFDLYRRSGNPNFNPATDADDNGVDMTVMLSALVSGGIDITHGDGSTENVKPYCYASVPAANLDDMRAVTDIFGAALWGANLTVAQQNQPALWDYVARSGEWGGHAIPGAAYTSVDQPGKLDMTVISWQEPIGTTDAFVGHQVEEVYVVVFPLLWDNPGFEATVDKNQLAADYTAATGKAFPVPVDPPAPVPNPVPGPVPVPTPPGPAPTPDPGPDPADTDLWSAIEHWATDERHTGDNKRAATAARAWAAAKGLN